MGKLKEPQRIDQFIHPYTTRDKDSIYASQLYPAIDKYRILSNETWKKFVLLSIALRISTEGDNPELVKDIVDWLENEYKQGRPKGRGLKARQMGMGVNPEIFKE